MNDYDIVEINLTDYCQDVSRRITNLSNELRLIEEKINIFEIVIRGGAVVDVLTNRKIKDVDIFYVLKDTAGKPKFSCDCEKIKHIITEMKLSLIGTEYKSDVGHYGKEEFWIPIVEKICGYFSHHVDFRSMFALTPEGRVFTNRKGLYCMKNNVYEMTFNTWPMTQNFLDNNTGNYYDIYNGFTFRGLRHMVKKGLSPGENYRTMLENWNPILKMTLQIPNVTAKMKKRFETAKVSVEEIVQVLKKYKISKVSTTERLLNQCAL